MFAKKILFVLVLVLCMATITNAQTIVFASRPAFEDPNTGETPDIWHILLLEDQGYDVIRFTNIASLSTASQATLDTLYNADLIVMGRSTPSTGYGDHKQAWNDITTPILNLELWNCRNSRLNWFNTATMVSNTEDVEHLAIIEVPDDPVFGNVDTSDLVPWIDGPFDAVGTKDAGNGTVLAMLETDSTVLFVRFDPDVEFYEGAGDYPAGYRTVLGNGRDNSGAAPFTYYNFTIQSEEVFLAEVERLIALGSGSAVKDREKAAAPFTLVLSQNYPNPFNPTTTIPFDLPERSHVRLSLSNILGKEVMVIADGAYNSGHHEVVLDAGKLAAGIYIYKIETESYTAMKKLALVK